MKKLNFLKKFLILFVLIIVLFLKANELFSGTFVITVGDNNSQIVNKAFKLSNGNIVILGTYNENNENLVFLSLLSEDGNLIKTIKLSNFKNFEGMGGIETSDKNILIVCSNFDENKGSILKITSDFSRIIWQKNFTNISFFDVVEISDHFIASGFTIYANILRGAVVKISNDGRTIESIVISSARHSFINSVISTNDGGFVLSGAGDIEFNQDGEISSAKIWMLKFNSNLHVIWSKLYAPGFPRGTIEEADSYVLFGSVANQNFLDYAVIKIKKDDGSIIWGKSYGGNGDDELHGFIKMSDGGYVLSGQSKSNLINRAGFISGIWVIRTDSSGSPIWQKMIVDKMLSGYEGRDLFMSSNGDVILTGIFPSNNNDILMARLNSNNGDIDMCGIIYNTNISPNFLSLAPVDYPISGVELNLTYDSSVSGINEIQFTLNRICGTTCTPPFPDVPCDHWAVDYIRAMKDAGITTGYPDGTYRPENPVKRSEMAAFIIRAIEGEPVSYNPNPYFADVLPTHWAFKYVQRVRERGIAQGYPGTNLYGPEDNVTREQMAKMLIMGLVSQGKISEPPSDYCSTGAPFPDVEIDRWSCRFIKRLKELNITTGYPDGTYRPENPVKRSEMAAFIYRAFLR